MSSAKKSKTRAMPALPTSPAPCLAHSLQNEDWPIEAQKVNDEQVQAFCREYAKTAPEKGSPIKPDDHIRRVKTALAEYTTRGLLGGKPLPEEFLRQGSEHILSPSPEELMELYATLLRDNLDLNPKMREVLTDQTFATATMTLHGDQIEQHFRQHHQNAPPQQRAPCGCGVDHGDEDALDFPEDSYEDEPDEEEDDDDEDDDERDEDDDEEEDSMDDDEYEEDDEQDVIDGYSHHYDDVNLKRMAYEEEKLKLETVRRVREEERRLKEEFRKKKLSERHKQKQEKDRIELLQRLRREDEERRKREALEKQRREKLELEMRRKREAAEADQTARSFLFQCTMLSQIETVKQMIGATPDDSCSLTGLPRFSTTAATRLFGWEYMTMVEGVGEVSEERGVQETLLHVAVRVGCADLATFFIDKGAPLDALDAEGLTPLHTAAKHTSSFEVCKLLVEKTAHHIDRTCIVSGKSALHYAAQNGNAELVALLLQHHARINPVDLKGNTPELLAKAGLESALSEKPSKANTKQANTAKAQKYRSTMQHLQKAIAAVKEAQSRKDAQLEEQRRKEEALAREEAEKDNAARRKQEEKLEADLRRRLEEEKELERLKAMASDPSGNSNNSNKKKKKKKGKGGNDSTPTFKEIPHSAISTSKVEHSSESAASSPALTSVNVKTIQDSVSSQSPKTATRTAATTVSPEATTKGQVSAAPTAPAKHAPALAVAARIPKPKTSYRPSQLVVTRMTDMGFPLRESRKALVQTEGRVEDAIDLLTSGAQLADDSEDEAELAAEKARAKQTLNAANALKAVAQVRPQDTFVNGHHPAAQPMAYQRTHNGPPGMFPVQQRPVNHPVQILQRTHQMAPQAQPRSVPTQVLQRPPPHAQNGQQPAINVQNQATRRSFSNQGVSPMSSPITHPATTLASFIAPRTGQPAPPTRAPYSYGPAASSTMHTKPMTAPSINTSQLHQNSAYKVSGSTSASVLDRSTPGRGSMGDTGLARKFGSVDISEHQGYGSSPGFSSFPTANSTWDMNLSNKGPTPTSIELPAPISAGYQQSSMGAHNLWATPGLSLPGPPLLQPVGDSSSMSPFGSPFLTSLPAPHHSQHPHQHSQQHSHHQHQLGQHQQQQHLPRSPTAGSSLGGLQGYGLSDMDLGNADGEMIKDVLAMTGAIDSEEFAKFEAEYSLLDSGFSTGGNNNISPAVPSRAVGGGRGSNSGASGQTTGSLWGNSGSDSNHHGLPSPIGTVNGHARRGLDGFDSHGSNGLSDSKGGGVSEYSQWNSGFALEQTMYPTTTRQQGGGPSSSFVDSFFGSQARSGSSPYNQHAQLQQQPMSPFDYSPFGGLGGSGGVPGGVSHTSPALSSSSLSNVIGSHGSRGGNGSGGNQAVSGMPTSSSSPSSAVKSGPNSPNN
ncbi:Tudor domain-containing protein 7 [Mortierella hygrophila]|uniref:Tudor domain-containing protein 7 n=1 Tax=Mortierella hygrophila TaxID=979708 RepID=A0A9P6FGG9_9FUNG|nr:Tudor domain-containing protein 7 [Mortierella hygrophila]